MLVLNRRNQKKRVIFYIVSCLGISLLVSCRLSLPVTCTLPSLRVRLFCLHYVALVMLRSCALRIRLFRILSVRKKDVGCVRKRAHIVWRGYRSANGGSNVATAGKMLLRPDGVVKAYTQHKVSYF